LEQMAQVNQFVRAGLTEQAGSRLYAIQRFDRALRRVEILRQQAGVLSPQQEASLEALTVVYEQALARLLAHGDEDLAHALAVSVRALGLPGVDSKHLLE